MELTERIDKVLKYSNLTRTALARKIGVNPQKLHDIVRGQTTRIPSDVLTGITKEFPPINPEWLLSGDGDMLLTQHATTESGNINQINGHNNNINSNNINSASTASHSVVCAPDEMKSIINALITSQAQTNMLIERLAIAQNQLLNAQANISELIELLKKK